MRLHKYLPLWLYATMLYLQLENFPDGYHKFQFVCQYTIKRVPAWTDCMMVDVYNISQEICISLVFQRYIAGTEATRPGTRFTSSFSIAIQIWWKFRFTLTSILIQWSQQNFVHGTTAVLSWHEQRNVAIWWAATELWQGEVFTEFQLRAKKVSETGPRMPVKQHWTIRENQSYQSKTNHDFWIYRNKTQ